jgi:serum/glucocorticoid-regulated kinase 2
MGNTCCAKSSIPENAGIESAQRSHSNASELSSVMDRSGGSLISNGMFSRDPNYSSSEISMDCFIIIKVIGRGSFGKVYLVKKKDDGKIYAVKTLKKDMILRKNQMENTKGKTALLIF